MRIRCDVPLLYQRCCFHFPHFSPAYPAVEFEPMCCAITNVPTLFYFCFQSIHWPQLMYSFMYDDEKVLENIYTKLCWTNYCYYSRLFSLLREAVLICVTYGQKDGLFRRSNWTCSAAFINKAATLLLCKVCFSNSQHTHVLMCVISLSSAALSSH